MSESDERYTPPEVMEPLRKLFGEMYDPCPRDHDFDGLETPWQDRNFVNPPYSQMYKWAAKAVLETLEGKFVAFLIPNDSSTEAYRLLKRNAWARIDIPFRVKFLTPSGTRKDVARSHCVFLLGVLWN